jgi:glycosyltransferase involved in cell wall biosynthesis
MHILALQPYLPYPNDNGGCLRSHYVLSALVERHSVTLMSISWDSRRAERIAEWDVNRRLAEPTLLIENDPSVRLDEKGSALRSHAPQLWCGLPDWIRGHDLPGFWNRLAALSLQHYDAVHVRNMHLAPYALALRAKHPHLRLILDLDDIGSLGRIRGFRSQNVGLISRWRVLLYRDIVRLRFYERTYLPRFDSVWVCSEKDRRTVARWVGETIARVVPNAVDVRAYSMFRDAPERPSTVLYAGDLRSTPNVAAIQFFCKSVWPLIRKAIPSAEFLVVGREPTESVLALHNLSRGIRVIGTVPAMGPYFAKSTIMAVPLLSGTGTRLKILEAMAAGLPVVATGLGAEGLGATNGTDLLIADSADDIAQRCIDLVQDPDLRKKLAANALRLVSQRYDYAVLRQQVLDVYSDAWERRAIGAPPHCVDQFGIE